MRFRLTTDAAIEAEDYADALRRVGEHFVAWAGYTPWDGPDTWRTELTSAAPQFLPGSVIHVVPEP